MNNNENSRLLVIHRYGDICYAPGYIHNGNFKFIVCDPDNQVMIDDANYFYNLISIMLSAKLSTIIPEESKLRARIVFKALPSNDTNQIEERIVYDDIDLDDRSIESVSNALNIVPIPVFL